METIVDQLKTVNSKSFLNEIKNPSNITILILKNFNNETNWDEISKFTQLNEIQLENCLIDNNTFFKAIAKIQRLTTLKYEVEVIVGGKVAQLGSRLIDGVAKKMADYFFGRFADIVSPLKEENEFKTEKKKLRVEELKSNFLNKYIYSAIAILILLLVAIFYFVSR